MKREALLALATKLKNSGAGLWRHSLNTANLTLMLVELLPSGVLDVRREELYTAALLHDIGKIKLEQGLLSKPGPLTPDEWLAIRRHPPLGVAILRQMDPETPAGIIGSILYHHERWDGKGYFGLAGADIPVGARVLAVADALDAMVSNRPYRPRLSWEEALAEIERNAGTQFAPDLAAGAARYLHNIVPETRFRTAASCL